MMTSPHGTLRNERSGERLALLPLLLLENLLQYVEPRYYALLARITGNGGADCIGERTGQ